MLEGLVLCTEDSLADLLRANLKCFHRTSRHGATAIEALDQHFTLVTGGLILLFLNKFIVFSLSHGNLKLHERVVGVDGEVFANYVFVFGFFYHSSLLKSIIRYAFVAYF